jgi:hypothetical protein
MANELNSNWPCSLKGQLGPPTDGSLLDECSRIAPLCFPTRKTSPLLLVGEVTLPCQQKAFPLRRESPPKHTQAWARHFPWRKSGSSGFLLATGFPSSPLAQQPKFQTLGGGGCEKKARWYSTLTEYHKIAYRIIQMVNCWFYWKETRHALSR